MATVESLIVELDAKVDKYNNAVNSAMQKTGRSTGKISRDFKSTEKSIEEFSRNGTRALKAFAATVVASLSVRALKNYADEWSGIQNRLKTVTDGTAELTKVTDTLLKSSNDTRSSFESTATLYQRLTQATSDMGFTQERVISLTESLNKSFAVGGANAQEQAGAIRQLAQALASGALRGDEFNSVSEQAPSIMDALVAATGKTKGELRELAAEGKITAEILVQAVEAYAPVVDQLFSKSVQTIDQTNTKISNSFTMLVGRIDEAAGVSASYASTGDDLARAFEGMDTAVLGVIDGIGDWATAWATAFDGTSDGLEELADTFERELLALNSIAKVTVDLVTNSFKDLPNNLKTIIELTVTEYASGIDRMLARGKTLLEGAKDLVSGAFLEGGGGLAGAQAELAAIEEARLAAINAILNRSEANKAATAEAIALLQKERDARREAAAEDGNSGGTGGDTGGGTGGSTTPFINLDGGSDTSLDKRISQLDSWLERLAESTKTEQQLLEEHYQTLNDLLHEKYAKDFVMTKEGEEKLAALDEKYAKAKAILDAKTADEQVKSTQRAQMTMLGILGNYSSGAQKIQQGLFAFEQAKSAAAILVSGAEGAEKAIGMMGPAGIPVAAGILAAAATLSSQTSNVSVGDTSLSAPSINTTPAQPETVTGQFSISEGGTNNEGAVVKFQANAGDDLGERLADWLNGQMKAGRIG